MTRELRIERRASEILAQALNKDTWQMLLGVARIQAEDEIGPPPYKPFEAIMHYQIMLNGRDVPVEDL